MLGASGMTDATRVAILNANYIKARLDGHYDELFTNHNDRVAHEMIFDLRPFKHGSGPSVDEQDVAKRLMDYGFHAPTVSFPVPGTMMIEPTESESKAELDRFCEALISIRREIQDVIDGKVDRARQRSEERAAYRRGSVLRRVDASVHARASRVSGAVCPRQQVLAGRRTHRQSVRRPQPDVFVPAD